MILIDKRVGSGPLFYLFPKGQAQLTTLRYGDFAFTGNGPEGMPYQIGIERKQIREIASTIGDGRLMGHQIPGLVREYQVVYLVVEGRWRGDPKTGILQTQQYWRKGYPSWEDVCNGTARFMANDIRKFLTTLESMAGVRLRYTEDQRGTIQEVLSLHSWWTGKEWEGHHAHLVIQGPPIERMWLRKPSVFQYMAACLPGIGWKRSGAVVAHFPTLGDMVMAGEKEWCKIEGVGKGVAKKVVEVINWRREG